MDDDALLSGSAAARARQDGVSTRAQLVACGGNDDDVARLVRRRLLTPVHRGVYLDHTGEPSWRQRAWAAVLAVEPAALDASSALAAHGVLPVDPRAPIAVALAATRHVSARAGTRVVRTDRFAEDALLHLAPPRMRVEHAALVVASRAGRDDEAVAVLAQAVQSRRTTAERLLAALVARPRLARRRMLAAVLLDVASGAHSALERRYLVDVERAHGLPGARRQRPERLSGGRVYRDVDYEPFGLVVELDGRLGHERVADRWRDLDRDVLTLGAGRVTLRAGWAQVLRPCHLAASVAGALGARGWRGSAEACGDRCDVGGLRAPGAGNPPVSTVEAQRQVWELT